MGKRLTINSLKDILFKGGEYLALMVKYLGVKAFYKAKDHWMKLMSLWLFAGFFNYLRRCYEDPKQFREDFPGWELIMEFEPDGLHKKCMVFFSVYLLAKVSLYLFN